MRDAKLEPIKELYAEKLPVDERFLLKPKAGQDRTRRAASQPERLSRSK